MFQRPLLHQVTLLHDTMLKASNNEATSAKEYQKLRMFMMHHTPLKKAAPPCLHEHRDLASFKESIHRRYPKQRDRKAYLETQFSTLYQVLFDLL